MLSQFTRHVATLLAILIGVAGVTGVLYAWRLPPFSERVHLTEDAFVQGQVTFLSPQVAGRVAEVLVQDYQEVGIGDVLVRIDARSYEQKLAQATAQLKTARAALDNALQERLAAEAGVASTEAGITSMKASLDVARDNLDRARELSKRGVITEREAQQDALVYTQAAAALDRARAEAEAARQDLASVASRRLSLAAAVEQMEAGVNLARLDLENTAIAAPVAGTLGEVSARVGQYVTPGTRVASLVPETIWIVANFKETQIAGLHIGQKVTFTVDALGDAVLKGTIERFSPATGSEFSVLGSANATGNFIKIAQRLPVRISIDEDQPEAARLAPGMSVVVRAGEK